MPTTIAERASGHMACGWRRRAWVVSSQVMSPWRPSAMNSANRPEAGQGSRTEVKPHWSKPRRSASSRTLDLGSCPDSAGRILEVEVVIEAGRREARPAVGEQGPKGGTGLD